MFDLILVDGPNLVNSIARRVESMQWPDWDGADAANTFYVREWLDLDAVIDSTVRGAAIGATLGTVVIHSARSIGSSDIRLGGARVLEFWGRQAKSPNTSCMMVDIPSKQQETYPFKCSECKHPNAPRTKSEKGIDVSMVVYLFESMERWNNVCLFTRDVDFVPAVWALRRRGKGVFVAGEASDAASALGRASQSFFELDLDFTVRDRMACEVFRPGGRLDLLLDTLAANIPGCRVGVYLHDTVSIEVPHARGEVPQIADLLKNAIPSMHGVRVWVEHDKSNDRWVLKLFDQAPLLRPIRRSAARWARFVDNVATIRDPKEQ